MIKVEGLTKVYKDRDIETRALNNVSFALPDKGLVFIVGKSGSGKSTLINMIGGLDDITEGQVIIDGFDLSKAAVHELDRFRNNYLGIIYQNYNLFNDETVFANIQESVDVISRKVKDSEINKIIDTVELKEKRNTLVKNLSGGQKQRVAIARALIKQPKLILADEPTGNLDGKTAKKIFDFLKKAASDCLVVIITHDMPSANQYADRIIEIADGSIVRDVTRKKAHNTKLRQLKLAGNQKISEDEIKDINSNLEKAEYCLVKDEDRFSRTKSQNCEICTQYVSEKQKYRKLFRKSLKTIARNKISTIITIVVCVVMISLMTVAAAFVDFNSEVAINDVLEKYDINNLVIRKAYSETGQINNLEKDYFFSITDADEEYLEGQKYTGRKFPVYTVDATCDEIIYGIKGTWDTKMSNIYSKAPIGTVVCDEEYLHKTFGDYTVLAGSLYSCQTTAKVIVPDFIADSIIFYLNLRSPDKNDPYQRVVNEPIAERTAIGAVISTNYKEKYASILTIGERIKNEPQHAAKLVKELAKNDEFTQFLMDASSYLNYCYSLNPNYAKHVYQNYNHNYLENTGLTIEKNSMPVEYYLEQPIAYATPYLNDYNVIMDINEYNNLFGTSFESADDPGFAERDFYITKYGTDEHNSTRIHKQVKLHVTSVFRDDNNRYCSMYISPELHREIMDWDIFTFAWVFEDAEQCYDLYRKMTPRFFYNPVECFKVVYDTINIIQLFGDTFNIILASLLIILVLIISLHNFRIIRNETYRFGVLKSMGYSSRYLALTLLIIDVFSLFSIFAFSILSGWGATLAANRLIQLGFAKYAHSQAYLSITMVSFNFIYVMWFSLILLGLLLITSFIPFLVIRRIKPNKIIRASE